MELELRHRGPRRTSAEAAARVQQLIRRKVSEKQRFERELDEVQRQLAGLLPAVERARQLAGGIHALFRQAVRHPGLSRRQRDALERLYRDLQDDLIGGDPDAEPVRRAACTCPACGAGVDEPTWDPGAARDPSAPDPFAAAEAPGAGSAGRDPGLRDLYRKLALHYHPDRAADDELRARHTEKMREVNDAYHGGDTARLLELSRELGIDTAELRDADAVLIELMMQYERVKAEVRALRDSPPGQLVIQARRAKTYRQPARLSQMRADLDAELEALAEVHELMADFAAGKLSVAELVGELQPDREDEDEEPLRILLERMGVPLEAERAGGRPPGRRAASKRGKRRTQRRR